MGSEMCIRDRDKITRFLPAGNSNVQILIFVNDGDLNIPPLVLRARSIGCDVKTNSSDRSGVDEVLELMGLERVDVVTVGDLQPDG